MAATYWAYFGTLTARRSRGIYVAPWDAGTGSFGAVRLVAETPLPTFLAVHPRQPVLYAVNAVRHFQRKRQGSVTAFTFDPGTGDLRELNQQPSGTAGPCHITTDRAGRHVLVANYAESSVAVLPIESDGRLGEPTCVIPHYGKSVNPQRQDAAHAHSVNLAPDERFAFVADPGLDKILIYRFDGARGILAPHDPFFAEVDPGAGPRHFAFHPSGQFAYVINELANTVTAFRYLPDLGELTPLQTISTLPEGYTETSYTAEVAVHPNGRLLYGSNRGHDSIAIFRIDPETGTLTAVGHAPSLGKWPRHFTLDPTGEWLLAANHNSDNAVVFRVEGEALTPVGSPLTVPEACCIRLVERG